MNSLQRQMKVINKMVFLALVLIMVLSFCGMCVASYLTNVIFSGSF